ncbi:MAG: hypothetical protein RLZZ271_1592 [Pseudomonadota bacterium]|jgi:hypothetical protein
MKAAHKILALTAIAFAASAQAQNIERMKMTDGDLNCQQIFTEIKQMDTVIAQANAAPAAAAPADNGVGQQVAGAVAQQAVAQVAARSGFGGLFGGGGGGAGSLLGGGGGGGLGGLFGGMAQQAAQQAVQQAAAPAPAAPAGNPVLAQQAAGRKEHLTGLFLGKQCKMSEVQ